MKYRVVPQTVRGQERFYVEKKILFWWFEVLKETPRGHYLPVSFENKCDAELYAWWLLNPTVYQTLYFILNDDGSWVGIGDTKTRDVSKIRAFSEMDAIWINDNYRVASQS